MLILVVSLLGLHVTSEVWCVTRGFRMFEVFTEYEGGAGDAGEDCGERPSEHRGRGQVYKRQPTGWMEGRQGCGNGKTEVAVHGRLLGELEGSLVLWRGLA